MNGEIMLPKAECKHKNKIKSGKHLYSDGYYQMYRCVDCGTVIKGTKIEEEKRINPAKNNAPISNQIPVKEKWFKW